MRAGVRDRVVRLRGLATRSAAAGAVPLLLPPVVVLWPNAPVVVLAAAVLGVSLLPGFGRRAVARAGPAVALAAAALWLWLAAASLWTVDGADPGYLASLAVIAVMGLALVWAGRRIDAVQQRWARAALALGVAAGVALAAFEWATGGVLVPLAQPRVVGRPGASAAYLQAGVTLLCVALWPAAGILARSGRRWLAALLPVLGLGLAVAVSAGAAGTAVLAGAAGWAAGRLGGPRAAGWLAAVLAACILAAPLVAGGLRVGPWMQAFPDAVEFSTYHRLAIWNFTADRIAERPVLGWGFDASRAIPGGEATLDPNADLGYAAGKYAAAPQRMSLHPHNGALQLWLEAGAVGALLGAVLVWVVVRTPGRLRDPVALAAALATCAAAFAVFGLSFGLWQSRWQAFLWLVAALTVSVSVAPRGDAPEGDPGAPET